MKTAKRSSHVGTLFDQTALLGGNVSRVCFNLPHTKRGHLELKLKLTMVTLDETLSCDIDCYKYLHFYKEYYVLVNNVVTSYFVKQNV